MAAQGQSVRAEEIYDALLDDDCLKHLPARFAQAYGARSCTLHWRHQEGGAEILSHSGYFSDANMLDYTQNFTSVDEWTIRGSAAEQINRVWNCDELVSHDAYEKGAFYNDWIRGMGDDTYFCMGTVMQTKWGQGIIGVHRGKTQSTFEDERIRALTKDVVHLRRMLTVRGRLAQAARQTKLASELLDKFSQAVMTVTHSAQVLHLNAAAEEILRRADSLFMRSGVLVGCSVAANSRLKAALARASDPKTPEATAIALPRAGGGQYELSLVPSKYMGASRNVLITVNDPDFRDCTLKHRLRELYGLSPVEAYLAVRLSEGASLAEVANERGVMVGTVHSQVKAVLFKMNCRRQAQIVKIVTSLPQIRGGADI